MGVLPPVLVFYIFLVYYRGHAPYMPTIGAYYAPVLVPLVLVLMCRCDYTADSHDDAECMTRTAAPVTMTSSTSVSMLQYTQ